MLQFSEEHTWTPQPLMLNFKKYIYHLKKKNPFYKVETWALYTYAKHLALFFKFSPA